MKQVVHRIASGLGVRLAPALFLALFLALSLAGKTANAQAANLSEQYLLAAANQERMDHQLPPVHADPLLAEAALLHAREMAARGTISHQFPGEPDLATRAGNAGVRFNLVTENVAQASNSALIHDLWMKSAGHRANLLDPHVDSVGIAVVAQHGQLFAVEDFARVVPHIPVSEQEAQVGALVAKYGVQILSDAQDARQTCLLSTGYVGSERPGFVMRYTASDLSRLPDQLTERLETRRYHQAAVGACVTSSQRPFTGFSVAVLLYP